MEGPTGGSFWGAFYRRPFLEGHFWKGSYLYIPVQIRAPLCGGLFMGSTYRRLICGGPMKRAPLWEHYEEGPFEIKRKGPFWIIFFQKPPFGYGRDSICRVSSLGWPLCRGPCLDGFLQRAP